MSGTICSILIFSQALSKPLFLPLKDVVGQCPVLLEASVAYQIHHWFPWSSGRAARPYAKVRTGSATSAPTSPLRSSVSHGRLDWEEREGERDDGHLLSKCCCAFTQWSLPLWGGHLCGHPFQALWSMGFLRATWLQSLLTWLFLPPTLSCHLLLYLRQTQTRA